MAIRQWKKRRKIDLPRDRKGSAPIVAVKRIVEQYRLFRTALEAFWRTAPALWLSLLLTAGIYVAFGHLTETLPLLCLLFLPLRKKTLILATAALVVMVAVYAHLQSNRPMLPEEGLRGYGCLHIRQVRPYAGPFQSHIVYDGVLRYFGTEEKKIGYNIPCKILFPKQCARPKADRDYWILATLKQNTQGQYICTTSAKTWVRKDDSFSFAEQRFACKERLRKSLTHRFPDRKIAAFFTALATAELDERSLALDFSRVGLSHILAVSGFHFALLTALISFLLRPLPWPRVATLLVLITISGYFFFLGFTPSVMRAWTAISLYLLTRLFSLQHKAINSLGCGLMIEVLIDPAIVKNVGFQLSFLCTAALLLLVAPCKVLIQKFFLPRSPRTVLGMSLLDQHGYLLACLLRSGLSVALAVHLVALPVSLGVFHTFPILSILYNLFFPFLVSISLLLLCCSTLCHPIAPYWTAYLDTWNRVYTGAILEWIHIPPGLQALSLHCTPSSIWISLWLNVLLGYAAYAHCNWSIGQPTWGIYPERMDVV